MAAFPSQIGHVKWVALGAFGVMAGAIHHLTRRHQLVWHWVSFQLLFGWLFAFIPPQLPDKIDNPVSFWAIGLLAIVGPVVYTLLFGIARRFRLIIGIGPLISGGVMVLGEWLFFYMAFQFPLTLAVTIFDQPTLLQPAAWGGWVILSWMLWCSNFAWMVGIEQPRLGYRVLPTFALLTMIWVGSNWGSDTSAPPRHVSVAAIQTNTDWGTLASIGLSPLYLSDRMDLMNKLTRTAARITPDIIAYPEAVLGREFEDRGVGQKILNLSNLTPVPMVLECRITTHRATSSSATILIQDGQILRYRHKTRTVPFIETAGTTNVNIETFYAATPSLNLGTLICFEILFVSPIQRLVSSRTDWVMVQANTGYFGQSNWPMLHAAYVPIRAVETGRPILLINDTGHSIASDEKGVITWYSGRGKTGVFPVHLTVKNRSTFFSRLNRFCTDW